MKILIFGAGAIGSAFGGFLSKHHDVTLLGREGHLTSIRKYGLRVTGIWGRHTFHFKRLMTCIRDLPPGEKFDLILCTVKSYSTLKAAKLIKKILSAKGTGPGKRSRLVPDTAAGSKTLVISLQNGLGNIETLCKFIPKRQVLAGRVIFGVELKKPGEIHVSVIAQPTAIGEIAGGKITVRVKKVARIFDHAGLPSVPTSNVKGLLWLKVIYNAALNPLASLLRTHYGSLGEQEITRNMMNAVIGEIYAVARTMKIRLDPADPCGYKKLFYSRLLPRTYDHHPSMLQDLRRGKRTEIDALNGMIVSLGERYQVAVPVNRLLMRLIKSEEKKRKVV